MKSTFLLPLLLLAGCAATAESADTAARDRTRLDKALAGLTPGAPMRCLDPVRVTQVRGFPGTILYVQARGIVYRNDVQGSCPGLRYGDTVITQSIGPRYCSGDLVRTRSPVGPVSGSCALGDFIPYRK